MTDEQKSERIKPLFLVKPKSMSPRDIRRAEKLAGICIVECAEPESARFLEPPIGAASIPEQAQAALMLMRHVMAQGHSTSTFVKADLVKWFVDALMYQPQPTRVERVKK